MSVEDDMYYALHFFSSIYIEDRGRWVGGEPVGSIRYPIHQTAPDMLVMGLTQATLLVPIIQFVISTSC